MQADRYEIRIRGTLSPEWMEWFEGMEIRAGETGQTILAGPVQDQAALHGLLARVRDLNLTLISVNRVVSPESPRQSRGKQEESRGPRRPAPGKT